MSIFAKYCDEDTSDTTTIEISPRLLSGDEMFIKNVCSEIRNFSLMILDQMDKVDVHKGASRDIIQKLDTTYKTLQPFCRMGDKCKKIYRFQVGKKGFVIQTAHIVQEFGLFLPMSINSLQYTDDIVKTVDYIHSKGKEPTGHLGKRIIGGTDGKIFGMSMSEFIRNKNTDVSHTGFVKVLELAILMEFPAHHASELSTDFQDWLNYIHDRICTVMRLRYIDLRVCNNFYSPMNKENKKHEETYSAFMDLRRSFMGSIEFMNIKRKRRTLRTYRMPAENDFDRLVPN